MFKRDSNVPASVLAGELFGVAVTLEAASPDVLERMAAWLPPVWLEGGTGIDPISLVIRPRGDGEYELLRDEKPADHGPLDDMIGSYELLLRNHVAQLAPEHVFIHAGTVAHGGRAIVIPGDSFSGKTTLVTELVKAGASYYSDEYAVLDRDGLVHPYPKPIAIRDGGNGYRGKSYHEPGHLGATTGDTPARIGLVLSTQYRRDAVWEPEELTPAQALMELIPYTFPSPARAAETMATLAAAIGAGVVGLKGDRGDATELAPKLLTLLDAN